MYAYYIYTHTHTHKGGEKKNPSDVSDWHVVTGVTGQNTMSVCGDVPI